MTTNTLAAGLVAAQAAVKRVGKDGKNKYHGYAYATAEDVIDAARVALGAGGVTCLTVASRVETQDLAGDVVAMLHAKHALIHASGETREIETVTPVIPEKGRPWDKAVAAALTFNLAYTLRGVLLIPRGDDDGGVDARDDSHKEPPPSRAASLKDKLRDQADPQRAAAVAALREAAKPLGKARTEQVLDVLDVGTFAAHATIDEIAKATEILRAQNGAAEPGANG